MTYDIKRSYVPAALELMSVFLVLFFVRSEDCSFHLLIELVECPFRRCPGLGEPHSQTFSPGLGELHSQTFSPGLGEPHSQTFSPGLGQPHSQSFLCVGCLKFVRVDLGQHANHRT